MADLGHQMTDEKLEQLERKVHKTYKEAYKEMQDKVNAYFDRLKDRDEEQKALLEAGKITEQQYQQWRLTQYARGERYRALRDEFARRMNEANKVAAAYINDQTPGIYSLNANYTAYTIEQSGASADFNLIQEQTVKRLIEEEPELFHRPAIDTPLDTVWNQRKLTDSLMAGILMGESTRQIADRFQKVTDMNRTSALRNARTAVTGAQNAGRQATYDRARAMGIEVDERWRSARDFRVRDSHRLMDGKPKDKDGYFHTPLGSIMRYPGDMQNGKAADVYNCRCTTSTRDALEAEPTMMRARDPVTGRNEVVQDMTYQEWYEWKNVPEIVQNAAGYDIIKVKKTTTMAEPNSITEYTSSKCGKDRNYYDASGRQIKQISNNGHGHKKEEALGTHGEHAHDYTWDSDGNMKRGEARELTEQERDENSDFLKSKTN